MNFSVHFDDATVERLNKAVERVDLTRNRIIVKAVQEWLERNEEKDWPEALKSHFRNPAPDPSASESLEAKAWRLQPATEDVRW